MAAVWAHDGGVAGPSASSVKCDVASGAPTSCRPAIDRDDCVPLNAQVSSQLPTPAQARWRRDPAALADAASTGRRRRETERATLRRRDAASGIGDSSGKTHWPPRAIARDAIAGDDRAAPSANDGRSTVHDARGRHDAGARDARVARLRGDLRSSLSGGPSASTITRVEAGAHAPAQGLVVGQRLNKCGHASWPPFGAVTGPMHFGLSSRSAARIRDARRATHGTDLYVARAVEICSIHRAAPLFIAARRRRVMPTFAAGSAYCRRGSVHVGAHSRTMQPSTRPRFTSKEARCSIRRSRSAPSCRIRWRDAVVQRSESSAKASSSPSSDNPRATRTTCTHGMPTVVAGELGLVEAWFQSSVTCVRDKVDEPRGLDTFRSGANALR